MSEDRGTVTGNPCISAKYAELTEWCAEQGFIIAGFFDAHPDGVKHRACRVHTTHTDTSNDSICTDAGYSVKVYNGFSSYGRWCNDDDGTSRGVCATTGDKTYDPGTHACRDNQDCAVEDRVQTNPYTCGACLSGFTEDPQGACQANQDCRAEGRVQTNPYTCGACLFTFTEDPQGVCQANRDCEVKGQVQTNPYTCGACLSGFTEGPGGVCNCPDGNAPGKYGDCDTPRLADQAACETADDDVNPLGGTWSGGVQCRLPPMHFRNEQGVRCFESGGISTCPGIYSQVRKLACVAKGLIYAQGGTSSTLADYCVHPTTGERVADECDTNNGGCGDNAACTDPDQSVSGNVQCACNSGFSMHGGECVMDRNECETSNGGCMANSACTDPDITVPGNVQCACDAGFSLHGGECVMDRDECRVSNGGCPAALTCADPDITVPDNVQCACPDGNAPGKYGDCNTPRLADQAACETADADVNPIGGTWGGGLCAHAAGHFHGQAVSCVGSGNLASCAENYAKMRELRCVERGGLYQRSDSSSIRIADFCVCPDESRFGKYGDCNTPRTTDQAACETADDDVNPLGGTWSGVQCSLPVQHFRNEQGVRCFEAEDVHTCVALYSKVRELACVAEGLIYARGRTSAVLADYCVHPTTGERVVDECETSNGGCMTNAACTDPDQSVSGNVQCACNAGFSLHNGECVMDRDECETNNGGCMANAACTDPDQSVSGNVQCACNAGFSLHGGECVMDRNECETNNGGCMTNAACTDPDITVPGNVQCACNAGFTLSGGECAAACPDGNAPGKYGDCNDPRLADQAACETADADVNPIGGTWGDGLCAHAAGHFHGQAVSCVGAGNLASCAENYAKMRELRCVERGGLYQRSGSSSIRIADFCVCPSTGLRAADSCPDFAALVSVFISPSSGGTVSAEWEGDADLQSGETIPFGATVTFTAMPEDGYGFSLWTGACADESDSPCVLAAVTMDATVGAEFGCLDFHESAAMGNLAGLKCNADAGANVNAPNAEGKTPLHLAAGGGHLELVQELLTLGATLNAVDDDDDTPLTEAAEGDHAEIFNLLVAAGGKHAGAECGVSEVPNPERDAPPCVSCGTNQIASDGVCESCGADEVASGGACESCGANASASGGVCECDSGHEMINESCVHETNALPENEATCAEVFGGDWVDLSAEHGVGKGVCSGIDINDTFCLAGTGSALPCLGLFNHVRSCNLLGRPALDPWHCGKACADGKASGARCLE